jgi:nuclear transport factor 2 (NTF2) superfamily protein
MSERWLPFPLLTGEAAALKIQAAEDAWNNSAAERVALEFSLDTAWRDRTELLRGRDAVIRFLRRKWNREQEQRIAMELWTHNCDRIALSFVAEWHDDFGTWFRSFGSEDWQVDAAGLIVHRIVAANDQPILKAERRLHWHWPGPRPNGHPGPSEMGL